MNRKERREEDERQLVLRRKAMTRSVSMMFVLVALAMVFMTFFGPSKNNENEAGSQPSLPSSQDADESLGPEALDQKEASREEAEKPLWSLVLVNAEYALPQDFSVSLTNVQSGERVDVRILAETTAMLEAAKNDGVTLTICSGYRSVSKQTALFEQDVKRYVSRGYSKEESEKLTMRTLQKPGYSEHHTGLAIDIVTPGHQTLDAAFDRTDAYAWLSEHAAEYGFILRYPQDKEALTGIEYEPWHYRYVGKEHAQAIREDALCLEEYTASLGLIPSSSF